MCVCYMSYMRCACMYLCQRAHLVLSDACNKQGLQHTFCLRDRKLISKYKCMKQIMK